jgi:hypothetical protein
MNKHELILNKWERELSVIGVLNEREFQELREKLVEKYGEERIRKAEVKACER